MKYLGDWHLSKGGTFSRIVQIEVIMVEQQLKFKDNNKYLVNKYIHNLFLSYSKFLKIESDLKWLS